MFKKNFSFSCCREEDVVRVSSKDIYHADTGYGFVPFTPQKTLPPDRFLSSGGWHPKEDGNLLSTSLSLKDSEYGVELHGRGFPLRFRMAVPNEGVYAVTLKVLGGDKEISGLNIYSGRRNLVKRDVSIAAGEEFSCRYYVHVCDYIPVMGHPPREDLSVYISIQVRLPA